MVENFSLLLWGFAALWLAAGLAILATAEIQIEEGAPKLFVVKSILLFIAVAPYLLLRDYVNRK